MENSYTVSFYEKLSSKDSLNKKSFTTFFESNKYLESEIENYAKGDIFQGDRMVVTTKGGKQFTS